MTKKTNAQATAIPMTIVIGGETLSLTLVDAQAITYIADAVNDCIAEGWVSNAQGKTATQSSKPASKRTKATVTPDSSSQKALKKAHKDAEFAPLQGANTELHRIEAAEALAEHSEVVLANAKEQAAKSSKRTSKKSAAEQAAKSAANAPKVNDYIVALALSDNGVSIVTTSGGYISSKAVRKLANEQLKAVGFKWHDTTKTWVIYTDEKHTRHSRKAELELVKQFGGKLLVKGEDILAQRAEWAAKKLAK